VITPISSLDDPRLSAYTRVADPAWLRGRGLFVAEGRLVVRRLIADGRFAVDSVLVTPAALSALEDLLGGTSDLSVYVCSQEQLNALAGFNFHRGCLALGRRPPRLDVRSLAGADLLIGLEAVGNPDNVGGIFRSALAFGAGGVLLDARSADPLYRKAIRTSMGAALRLPFAVVEDWGSAIERLREIGFRVAALTPAEDASDITSMPASERLLLLFGSEGEGLSAGVQERADARLRIPIDPRSDSLNVAVAAGIALFAARSLRRP
jgi:tRNA G18 (ribose-2'-O)-methylase SpoU